MGSTNALRVLFCDTAFSSGFRFATQELESNADIEVVGDFLPAGHAPPQRLLQMTDVKNPCLYCAGRYVQQGRAASLPPVGRHCCAAWRQADSGPHQRIKVLLAA